MSDAVKAVLTTSLGISNSPSANSECPQDIQYMPPGKHRINASRKGKPVSLDITVDAGTAETLNSFLQKQLTQASSGSEDRPFFDFNHEDREASAWPTEFYWAGDDPVIGGVRAKLEWSGAGKTAIEQKTFRRFSPTFIPNSKGKVIGSETNMGGLVNRAAFKTIQPLFAKEDDSNFQNLTMHQLKETLHELKIVSAKDPSEVEMISAVKAKFTELQSELTKAKSKIAELEENKQKTIKARAEALVTDAIQAGKIAPKDETAKAFWTESLVRDEASAVKALESLPVNPVLQTVTAGSDAKSGALDKMSLQQKKLAEISAANPGAAFEVVFANAQSEAPDLFN